MFVCLFVYLFVCLFVCLFICLLFDLIYRIFVCLIYHLVLNNCYVCLLFNTVLLYFIFVDKNSPSKTVETVNGNDPAVEITEIEEEVVTSLKRTINIRHNKDVKEAVRTIGMEKIKDQTVNNGISVSRNSSCNTTELIQAVRSASTSNLDKKHSDTNVSENSKISRKKTDENVIQVFRSYRYLGHRFLVILLYFILNSVIFLFSLIFLSNILFYFTSYFTLLLLFFRIQFVIKVYCVINFHLAFRSYFPFVLF